MLKYKNYGIANQGVVVKVTKYMKIDKYWKSRIRPDQPGSITITPEDQDDIWAIYNTLNPEDIIESSTTRRVLQENSAGDVVDSHKIKLFLAIKSEKIDIDLQASVIRVNGRNMTEGKHVKLGAYHTIDVEIGKSLKIFKSYWDSISIEYIEQAVNSLGKAEVGAILFQEGLGFTCLLSLEYEIKILERIEVSLGKKKLGPTGQHERAIERFYEQLIESTRTKLDFERLRAIVIASFGQLKDDYYNRLMDWANKSGEASLSIKNQKQKIIRINLQGNPNQRISPALLNSVLKEPRIAQMLSDTKSLKERKLLDQFYKLDSEEKIDGEGGNGNGNGKKTTFGPNHILEAANQGAIKNLLLADSLFKSCNLSERKMYANIVDTVKQNGGTINLFIRDSPVEIDLLKLSGIAAILNFPIEFSE